MWLLAFGKEAKPFGKSLCNSRVTSILQVNRLPGLDATIKQLVQAIMILINVMMPGYVFSRLVKEIAFNTTFRLRILYQNP